MSFRPVNNNEEPTHDYYGFPNKYKYDRTLDYQVETPFLGNDSKKIFISMLIIGFLILIISMGSISGYYAWFSFQNDPYWVRIIRTYVAVLFSPFYIFYIFIKTTVFKT